VGRTARRPSARQARAALPAHRSAGCLILKILSILSSPSPSDPLAGITGFKRLRYRLEHAALEAVAWLIPRFPYDAIEPLANMLGSLAYAVDARGRTSALENLKSAFGDQYTPDERERIAKASYQNFARTMLSLFWSPNLTNGRWKKVLRVEGLELDSCHGDPSQPALYFCAHFGNFEWLSHASAFAIATGPIIFQKFKNPLLGPVFSRLRAVSGHEIIPQERALIRMLKHLKGGGKFGALTDLSLDPKHGTVAIRCFGLWTSASPILHALRDRTGAKLIPCECVPEPDGTYVARYLPAVEIPEGATAAEITQLCWNEIERSIRARPELWLWAYKQWRFKPSAAPADALARYPVYANTAKRFDRLIRETAA
jgi:lauroyl/myristoyl acyltransferase